MTQYEKLLDEISSDGIEVIEFDFINDTFHGLYADGCIAINKNLSSREKLLTAYEEWGHHKTSYGNILGQSKSANRRQEKKPAGGLMINFCRLKNSSRRSLRFDQPTSGSSSNPSTLPIHTSAAWSNTTSKNMDPTKNSTAAAFGSIRLI